MTQPIWKLVYATDYSALYADETGVHAPELAVAQEIPDDVQDIEATAAVVYRVVLDRLKVSDAFGELRAVADDCFANGDLENAAKIEAEIWAAPHYLISRLWNPSWNKVAPPSGRDEWFVDSIDQVARSIDSTRDDLERALCSDDPATLAWVYEAIGDYHGFINLDSAPHDWTASEFKEWPERGEKLDENERDNFTAAYITCALWCGVIDERTKCEECDGTGHVMFRDSTALAGQPDEQRECEACEGTGEIEPTGNSYEDGGIDESDLESDALESLTSDAHDFYESNVRDLRASTLSMEQAGHDFWLTRNRHGAGFWDRKSLGKEADAALDRLTDASHAYGEAHLALGDSGKVGVL